MKSTKRFPAIGDRFGRLTVSEPVFAGEDRRARVVCRCECGTIKTRRVSSLLNGSARSCGCLARELTSQRTKRHGLTYSPEWAAWRRIIGRCSSRDPEKIAYYGAKGIAVCERWRTFENFLADMGAMPEDKRTIDRIDNAKGYEPGNCRWASVTEQNRNKTSNVRLTHGGRTMTVAEWAREIGMSHNGLHDRLRRMTPDEALTLPDQRGQRRWRNAA